MNKEELIDLYNKGNKFDFIFFYSHKPGKTLGKECFSNWYECNFKVGDTNFHTSEQFLMAMKAILFNDDETYNQIMSATTPKEYKELGRKVKNFDSALWDKKKFKYMCVGLYNKFTQNAELHDFLIDTDDKILVEGSPYDTIWGIGMREETNPNLWKGENLLGFALMRVRDLIYMNEELDNEVDLDKVVFE